jgi:hypothetical protein
VCVCVCTVSATVCVDSSVNCVCLDGNVGPGTAPGIAWLRVMHVLRRCEVCSVASRQAALAQRSIKSFFLSAPECFVACTDMGPRLTC